MNIKKPTIQIAAAAIVVLLIVGAVVTGHVPGHMNHSMGRHIQGLMRDVPEPYAGMANPLPDSAENIKQGEALFIKNCRACHGSTGRGDGSAGVGLSPKPSDLTHIVQAPMARDGYLFWAISEGGMRFDTAMPAFSEVLDEPSRWQLVHYLRTLGSL